jgi:hypothetical protein
VAHKVHMALNIIRVLPREDVVFPKMLTIRDRFSLTFVI